MSTLQESIANCCKTLKLSRNLVENSGQVTAETHQEYLHKLLKMELEYRAAKRKERLLKIAGFYTIKTFAGFRFDEIRLPQTITPEDLKECRFIANRQNLILFGHVGTGKTHLATAIGVEACRQGLKVGFYRTAALVNKLSTARKSGNLERFLTRISQGRAKLLKKKTGKVPPDREFIR